MLNDLMDLLLDVPPTTAMAWAVWLAAGLLLNIWHRRARASLVYDLPESRGTGRHKSGPRAAARPSVTALPAASAGDAFGDLEKIFEEQNTGSHRTPGESPILSSAGTPVLREPNLESTR